MRFAPGLCQARSRFRAFSFGKHGPQLAVGILESENTRLASRASSVGMYPHGWRLFLVLLFKALALPKPVEWLPVASQEQIADSLVNAVTFLQEALRLLTHTLFSFQGTTSLFFLREQKVEMYEARWFKRGTLTTGVKTPWLARAEAWPMSTEVGDHHSPMPRYYGTRAWEAHGWALLRVRDW